MAKVVAYQLRHGGASCDIASQRRTIEQVKSCERWLSDASSHHELPYSPDASRRPHPLGCHSPCLLWLQGAHAGSAALMVVDLGPVHGLLEG